MLAVRRLLHRRQQPYPLAWQALRQARQRQRGEGAETGEVWGDAHGCRPCQRVVTVSPVLRPSASYW